MLHLPLAFIGQEGRHLGVSERDVAIDATSNPVEIDAYSYESTKENNLFAMGELFPFDNLCDFEVSARFS